MKIKRGKIITITSMKGGVGKTTAVLGISYIYSNLKKKTLIIDLDLFTGSIAFALNLNSTRNIYNLYDDISNNRLNDMDKYVVPYNEFIDVLTSPKDPRYASKIDKVALEKIITNYSYLYDVIIIDTSHLFTVTNLVAYSLSDKILNLLTNDIFDLKNTKNFITLCHNIGVDNLTLILNESNKTNKGYFSMYDMKSIIGSKISYVIPKDFYIKNYDMYIMENKVFDIFKKLKKEKTYLTFEQNLLKILESEEVEYDKE